MKAIVVASLLLLPLSLLLLFSLNSVNAHQTYITHAQCTSMGGGRFRNWCYTAHNTRVNWVTARNDCISRGGQLASVYSAAENAFIHNFTTTFVTDHFWFGLSDTRLEGQWVWEDLLELPACLGSVDGATGTNLYCNWNTLDWNEPNGGVDENCGMIWNSLYPGKWNDESCATLLNYVCKYTIGNFNATYCSTVGGSVVNSNCYYTPATSQNWINSVRVCRETVGDITTPPSTAEAASVRTSLGINFATFVGLNDAIAENTWTSADSPNVTVSIGNVAQSGRWAPWASGAPNGGTNENCAQWQADATLNDVACLSTNARALCRIPVSDNVPPTITCPSNINVTSAVAVVVTWGAVSASDTSGLAGSPTLSSNPSGYTNGSSFPIGAYNLTYTVADTVGNLASCSFRVAVSPCSVSFIPALQVNQSGVVNGITLDLTFVSAAAFINSTFAFVGAANASCNSVSNVFWTTAAGNPTACSIRYEALIPLNYALAQCGFQRDESQSGVTSFSATVLMTTNELKSTLRGLAITQTVQSSVTVTLKVSTTITTTSGTLQVYGSRITFSRVVNQVFSPINYVATLQVFTSVQFPYQLTAPVLATVSGFTTAVSPLAAESGRPTTAICVNNNPSPSCGQTWVITIQRTTSCSPAPSTLNYNGWNLSFSVTCHTTFSGSCNTPAPDSDAVTFDTASDNYCPALISTISSTASLSAFANADNTGTNAQYVFGTRTYFRALVTSPVNIANLRIERVALVSGAAAGVTNLYVNTFTNALNFFDQNKVGTYANQLSPYSGTFAAVPTLMQMTENQSTGNALTRAVSFNWIWSPATSSANSDNPVSTVVQVDLRIRYQNQSTVGDKFHHDELLSVRFQPHPHGVRMLETTADTATVSSVVGIVASSNDDGDNGDNSLPISSSTSSSTSVTVVGVVAGVAAVFVAVAMVVVVIMRHRRAATQEGQKNQESVELPQVAASSSTVFVAAQFDTTAQSV